jgi:hypothetical protein
MLAAWLSQLQLQLLQLLSMLSQRRRVMETYRLINHTILR